MFKLKNLTLEEQMRTVKEDCESIILIDNPCQ